VIAGGSASTTAMKGSTEEAQFHQETPDFADAEIHHVPGSEPKFVPPPQTLVPPQ
jgi:hypothetical protein